jgi:hypothetical protein
MHIVGRAIEASGPSTVLVAHSYGGFVRPRRPYQDLRRGRRRT